MGKEGVVTSMKMELKKVGLLLFKKQFEYFFLCFMVELLLLVHWGKIHINER